MWKTYLVVELKTIEWLLKKRNSTLRICKIHPFNDGNFHHGIRFQWNWNFYNLHHIDKAMKQNRLEKDGEIASTWIAMEIRSKKLQGTWLNCPESAAAENVRGNFSHIFSNCTISSRIWNISETSVILKLTVLF